MKALTQTVEYWTTWKYAILLIFLSSSHLVFTPLCLFDRCCYLDRITKEKFRLTTIWSFWWCDWMFLWSPPLYTVKVLAHCSHTWAFPCLIGKVSIQIAVHVENEKKFLACTNWMFESHTMTIELRLSSSRAEGRRQKSSLRAKIQFYKSRTVYLLFWTNKVYNFFISSWYYVYCTTDRFAYTYSFRLNWLNQYIAIWGTSFY